MRIISILENQKIEKRIAITPEIAKKYISLGFEVAIVQGYGEHLGFRDSDYKELGVEISTNEVELLNNKIIRKYGKIHLKDYITSFIKGWNIMKIKSSLKSLKKRDLNSKLVRRRGRVYIINKTNPKFKARQK